VRPRVRYGIDGALAGIKRLHQEIQGEEIDPQNEIGCARISIVAKSVNALFTGRLQKRKTNPLYLSHPACNTRPVHTEPVRFVPKLNVHLLFALGVP
jgi:hypothetical protein